MSAINQIKKEIKQLAKELSNAKRKYKKLQSQNSKLHRGKVMTWKEASEVYREEWDAFSNKNKLKDDFRHKHIAWSLLKGRKYEQIERYTRPDNEPCAHTINLFIQEYAVILGMETYPKFDLDKSSFDQGLSDTALKIIEEMAVTQKLKENILGSL